METGEVIFEKVFMSLRAPLKISETWFQKMFNDQRDKLFNNPKVPNQTNQFQTQMKTTRTPVVCRDASHAQSAKQTRSSDDSKSLNVDMAHDRTGQPVVETNTENVPNGSQTRFCHESISFNVGDETIHDRTGQLVVNHDVSSHEQTMLNEVNMDFRIPGLPHFVVKHVESSRVRELVKKVENPQIDMLFNKTYNRVNHLIPSVQNQNK